MQDMGGYWLELCKVISKFPNFLIFNFLQILVFEVFTSLFG